MPLNRHLFAPLCVALSSHSLLWRTTKRLEIHKNLRIQSVKAYATYISWFISMIYGVKYSVFDTYYPELRLISLKPCGYLPDLELHSRLEQKNKNQQEIYENQSTSVARPMPERD